MAAANYMDASYAVSGRRLLLTLAAAVATLAIALAATVGLLRLVAPDWLRSHGTDLRAIFLVEAYLALGAGLLAGFGGPDGVARRLRFRFTSLTDVALAIGLWVVTLFVGGLVTAALTPILGPPQSNAVAVLRLAQDPLFVVLVLPTVTLLAPAAEEIVFRGGVLGWLSGRLPFVAAALLTAALFAAAHLVVTAFAYLFLFGLAAAWVVHRTGSTFNCFVMHACQNMLAVVSAYSLLAHGGGAP